MSGQILLQRQGAVATLVIDNPGKLNAISQSMWIALAEHLKALQADAQLRCIVLRGAGEQAFGSGADIDEFETIRSTKAQAMAFAAHAHHTLQLLQDCPIPTVAAIRGVCVGGGLELAACCDLRMASADGRFGIPIAKLGAVLAYPELQALVRVAGAQFARELLLEGRILGGEEALSKGLITRLLPVAEFEQELAKTLERISQAAPLSARTHKRFIARLQDSRPLTPEELEEGYACFDTADFVEGYRAFLDKRSPVFQGK